jgi:predicted ATPase
VSNARIYSFDRSPIALMAHEELEHMRVTRDLLNNHSDFIE